MPILYGVTFPEPIMSLPRLIQKGIPGNLGWDKWPGWSVQMKGARVFITQEPIDLADENVQGFVPGARDEHEANNEDRTLRLVYSLPVSACILLYVEGEPKERASSERSPTPALLKAIEDKKKVPLVRPPGVPTTAYQGPPVTPMRAARPMPPGPVRPPEPPPSTIIMDDEDAP